MMFSYDKTLLQVQNLRKTFGNLVAVDDLSFQVQESQIVGLIGPNGAGKTTTFNLISGLFPPTSGRIFFKGKDVTRRIGYQRARQGITRTFESIAVFDDMTVWDNVKVAISHGAAEALLAAIFCPLYVRKISAALCERIEELLTFVGLEDYSQRLAKHLSYGQRKRLEIARVLATGADLLLFDEPTKGLDEQGIEEIIALLRSLPYRGKTLLITEHNRYVIMQLAHHIIVIDRGAKVVEGSPEEVAEHPVVKEAYWGRETYVVA
jgi:ABC-type branched-subunit amino acid transport system ATPase component